jgi:hypothetical protein
MNASGGQTQNKKDTIMKDITPSLTTMEMFSAACHGCMRRINAVKQNKSVPYGDPKLNKWGLDIESCASEMIVGKYLNQFWHQTILLGNDKAPCDVGENVEVRHTPRLDGRLIVYERDKDASYFVSVVGAFPEYKIVGWMKGEDAKKDKYWWADAKYPAWFVDQCDLNPPETLKEQFNKGEA